MSISTNSVTESSWKRKQALRTAISGREGKYLSMLLGRRDVQAEVFVAFDGRDHAIKQFVAGLAQNDTITDSIMKQIAEAAKDETLVATVRALDKPLILHA